MHRRVFGLTGLALALVVYGLFGVVTRVEGTVICREDYNRTNYNLFCADSSQVVYVNVLTASFVLKNVQSNCYAQSSLILNASTSLVTNICNYCFNKDPCVISQSILDQNGLFNVPTYNVDTIYNSQPISINILYQCVDRVDLSYYPPQSNLCASPTTITKYVSTTGTTTTYNYNSGSTNNNNNNGGYTTRPPYTVTVPTIATNTYYPIYPNGYIYCLSGAPRLASLAELKFVLAPLSFLLFKFFVV